MPEFRHIEASRLRETTLWVEKRIRVTFPGRSLGQLAYDLRDLVGDVEARCVAIARPNWPLRLLVGLVIATLVALLAATFHGVNPKPGESSWTELLQGIEAGLNELVMVGLVILFLTSLETRWKRRRALAGLSKLRGVAHVIDLHQMTKDPQIAVARMAEGEEVDQLDPRELAQYLSFCADLLSIVGKAAALYGQVLDDGVVLATVDEVESLSARAAGKIWQKLALVQAAER